jgi:hypothetical protein
MRGEIMWMPEKASDWTSVVEVDGEVPSGAKARIVVGGPMYGLKPVPFIESSPSSGAKALDIVGVVAARLKSCPDTRPSEASC